MDVAPPLRVLLRGAIDYAGLYPPAALPMTEAVARYAEYRASADRWALGRFVVGAAKLDALAAARAASGGDAEPWPLSVLAGDDPAADAERIARLAEADPLLHVESVEGRIGSADDALRLRGVFGTARELYGELPAGRDPAPLVAVLGGLGLRAKIRTGGVTAEAIPSSADVARFLVACVGARVPFKATAGLHHPLRADHPLTYEPSAPRAVMHGWLNVFLAAALLAEGGSEGDARLLLEERDPAAFDVSATGIAWRGRRLATDALRRLRAGGLASFGSCSFREPLDELAALHPLHHAM